MLNVNSSVTNRTPERVEDPYSGENCEGWGYEKSLCLKNPDRQGKQTQFKS